MPAQPSFIDDHVLVVGETEFYCSLYLHRGRAHQLPVMKDPDLVQRWIQMIDALAPEHIVEFGIQAGGSTALLAELAAPTKLVAMELSPKPVEALADHLERRRLGDIVRPYYGIDQADTARVAQVLDEELGDTLIDLVIDDASHRYGPTLATFDLLFPRLRPGGTYIVEDWNGMHLVADALVDMAEDRSHAEHQATLAQLTDQLVAEEAGQVVPDIPLTQLAVELVSARASAGDVIRSVCIEASWIVVTRGSDPLPPGPFELASLVRDHEGFLPRSRTT
jgi:predicted O-methyltransferase YrrM